MIRRAYYSNLISVFLQDEPEKILGVLAVHHEFALEDLQRNAWLAQIQILKDSLIQFKEGYLALEYAIPRMGKRVDAIFLLRGLVFVIEFKVGEEQYPRVALDQVMDYALDLKNFHEASHTLPIIPVLVATNAGETENTYAAFQDLVYDPLKANQFNLGRILSEASLVIPGHSVDSQEWLTSAYKPTPTIIEAAQALFRGHSVADISRSEAGATNLTRTSDAIVKIIEQAKATRQKAICFITGVPGAGKTLAGLNIANARLRNEENEYAVFLSGNGPLVSVLQEALARDEVQTSKLKNSPVSKKDALRKAKSFIQNIHFFRDEALGTDKAPTERIVVFDEAQRAWTLKQTAAFMRRKRRRPNFAMSEPEFLISIMDRHVGWAVIICLIGGGQEINTGEAGLVEWFVALGKTFPHWNVYVSNELTDMECKQGNDLHEFMPSNRIAYYPTLHLSVSIRSFRSEKVTHLVKAILDLDMARAQELYRQVGADYPIKLTRDLETARAWLKSMARGTERYGLLASSGGIRLRPIGIDVNSEIEVEHWFLDKKEDVRSSYALEQAATEFDIQGLELDWTAVVWDADLRFRNGVWDFINFIGSTWQNVNDETRRVYLKNAYRVLLTRARQGMVVLVPQGDNEDETRKPEFYDETFDYMMQIGFEMI